MTPLEWVNVRDVHREVHAAVYEVLIDAEARGWRLRRQGHKFKFFCPCESREGSMIRIDGTPRNPEQQAKRIRREVSHCPDRHSLDH